MRTLHTSYRVSDLVTSLVFYTTLGYQEVGRVDLADDESLVLLKFPDEEVVTLELVHRSAAGEVEVGTGFHHLAIEVEDLHAFTVRLSRAGLAPGPIETPGPKTSWLTDPDGYRIELVEWPPDHPHGITAADFA